MIGNVIFKRLKDNGTIAAAVLSGGVYRIYPVHIPQGAALPNIRYTILSDIPTQSKESRELQEIAVQVDFFSETYTEGKTLAAAGIAALEGASGTIEGVAVDDIILTFEGEQFEDADDEEGKPIFHSYIRVNIRTK